MSRERARGSFPESTAQGAGDPAAPSVRQVVPVLAPTTHTGSSHNARPAESGVHPSTKVDSTMLHVASDPEKLPRQFGKYTLMRKLASGGMAELFLALHRSVAGFEKFVVIKRILPQMNQDRQFIDMLLHEARIAATLTHPNIVQTYDVGQVEGTYFIAMEHIEGEDIRTIIREMKKKALVEFPLEHALAIVIGLCAGIAYAHEKRGVDGKNLGIVHRDISPQNIVVTFSGDIKVVDFGVAKSLHASEESKGGHLKGKVPYMSPEQAEGQDIDFRSDIFAAGVILFELTTGRRLFKSSSEYDTLKLICETEYPMPSDVAPNYPAALERIVMKALAKNPDARYQSARDMQAELESFVRQERLPVSTVSMGKWMQDLFADKLAMQKADLQDIKPLADQIAAQYPPQDFSPATTGSHPSASFDQSSTGAGAPGAAKTIPPREKRGAGMYLGMAALLVAAGGVAFFALKSRNEPAKQAAAPTVETAATQPSAAAPAADPRGAVRIESDPAGAAIWINGDLKQEVTPATIDNLPFGSDIQIKVSKEGFESYKETVKLAQGDEKKISVKLDTGSVTAELDVNPEPTVWVDGKPWKGDWKKISGLSADEEHKIVVSATGYVPKTFSFTGKQGDTKTFKHALVRMTPQQLAQQAAQDKDKDKPKTNDSTPTASGGTGTVRVNAKGGFCNVSVKGGGAGVTPFSTSVPAGNVTVTCKPESGPTQSQTVKVEPGGTARVTFNVGG
ncbi:MAG: serine/threonine protein kinase [Polyangiaceae bacterium]|nr:serine/threonine protein kinase [Polyangiaceae bacterium]